MDNCDILINGIPLYQYGGCALLDYSIGETELTNTVFQGINRTSWRMLKAAFGQRKITMTVVFTGRTLHEAKLLRSTLNGKLFGRVELYISDDGFFYDAVCDGTGAEQLIGNSEREAKIKSEYSFTGMRRDALVRATIQPAGIIFCRSTTPYTDCRLSVTVGASAAEYALGGAVFKNVSAGDVLVFDGIEGKLTRNGVPYAANVSWLRFPDLTPGMNQITASDPVIVEYYPTYI